MILQKVWPGQIEGLAPMIHRAVFNEIRESSENRYNYALVVANSDKMVAYATVIEMDDETAYMQHGGAFPEFQGTAVVKRAYGMLISYLKAHYKRISTRIQNTNVPMIKLALSEGLLINGCFCYERDVFLSLGWSV